MLWYVRAEIGDEPGTLARLAGTVAELAGNILELRVHTGLGAAVDELVIDVPDAVGIAQLTDCVRGSGASRVYVRRADTHELVDATTRALDLADGLIRGSEDVTAALVAMLRADDAGWTADESGPAEAEDVMRLRGITSGHLWVRRTGLAFTGAEYARARALVRVARTMVGFDSRRTESAALTDGRSVQLREAGCGDVAAVVEMHERCSAATQQARYLGAAPTRSRMHYLLTRAPGHAMVATDDRHRVVAVANLLVEGPEAELALLVEDRWQGSGLGTVLARRMLRVAGRRGCHVVHAHGAPDNRAFGGLVRRLGCTLRDLTDAGIRTVTLSVAGHDETPAADRFWDDPDPHLELDLAEWP
jgi:GNAT superfamily N-acetyltransferase